MIAIALRWASPPPSASISSRVSANDWRLFDLRGDVYARLMSLSICLFLEAEDEPRRSAFTADVITLIETSLPDLSMAVRSFVTSVGA